MDMIRQLAKSDKYRNLFYASKELSGINLFKNFSRHTKIQVIFLQYLFFYDILMRDIAMEEVSEDVLKNDIYEDAYYYYKSKTKNKPKSSVDNSNRKMELTFVEEKKKE